jgi:methionyl-tRNA synthetase
MLLSAGLPTPKSVLVHGFVQTGGQKMSKSLGNVVDPFEIAEKYGLEAFRYYMLSQIPTTEDGDFTVKRFIEVYNADLANGLGNLVARVARLCERVELDQFEKPELTSKYKKSFDNYQLNVALEGIWDKVRDLDGDIERNKPWAIKDSYELKKLLQGWVQKIYQISYEIKPFLPETAGKIEKQFATPRIKSAAPLFPRI